MHHTRDDGQKKRTPLLKAQFLLTHMMNSLGWQTTDATPPIMIQGLITVWPPVTEVPPSSAASRKPRIISGITRSRSCVTRAHTDDTKSLQDTLIDHDEIDIHINM